MKEGKKEAISNPLIPKIDEIVNKCMVFLHKMTENAFTQQANIKTMFFPHSDIGRDKKGKVNTRRGMHYYWHHIHKIIQLILGQLSEPNDEILNNFEKITEEWTCGIKGEAARLLICVKLLKQDLLTNVTELYDIFLETFHEIYERISHR